MKIILPAKLPSFFIIASIFPLETECFQGTGDLWELFLSLDVLLTFLSLLDEVRAWAGAGPFESMTSEISCNLGMFYVRSLLGWGS